MSGSGGAACRLEPCLTPRRVRAGHRAPGQLCRAPHDRRTAADAADRPVGARPPLMSQSQSLRSRVSESVRRPEFINDLLQILKCVVAATARSEEHTSELQSRGHLVCRLLLEKKNYA